MQATLGLAEEGIKESPEGLDQQIEATKKDVLRISSELYQLQEKLMFPASTEVSLYLSFTQGNPLYVEAIVLKLDGNPVAQHIYGPREAEALQRGAVQKLYTGSVRSGTHVLDIEVEGQSADGKRYQHATSHKFYKMKGAKVIEITLSESGSSIQSIAD